MPVSFVANALGGTTTTTSFSITLPTTQSGDIIILEYTHRGTTDATLGGTYSGGGFTEKHDQQYATSTFSGKTLWARATGNHSGQTVTGSGLTDSCAAIITVYRGALASGDPLTGATIVGEQNASGNETQAEIVTTHGGAMVVLVVANSPDVAVTAQTAATLGTLTARAERLSTGGTDTAIAHASKDSTSAAATGAFTWAQTNGAGGSWAYAIREEPALAYLEGDDSYGLSHTVNTSAVPRRSAALALATAVAIAGSFSYQDEAPVDPTVLGGGADSQRVQAVGEELRQSAFQYDDDIVPQPAAGIVEEDGWRQPVWVVPKAWVTGPVWDDPVPVQPVVDEGEGWVAPRPRAGPPQPATLASDDIVPQPVAFIPEEDYWLQLRSDRSETVLVHWPVQGGGGVIPAAVTPLEIIESDWQVYTPPPLPPKRLYLPGPEQFPLLSSEQVVGIADYGFAQTRQHKPLILWWQQPDDFPQQNAPDPLEIVEEDWRVFTPAPPRPGRIYLPDPETEYPTLTEGTEQGAPQESGFTQRRREGSTIVWWQQPDELPQFSMRPEEEYWQVSTPAPLRPVVTRWSVDDELPVAAVAAVPVESDWQPFKPIVVPPVVTVWTVGDELPPVAVAVESDWQPFKPQVVRPTVTLWAVGDEIVPQPIPLEIDESDWQVYTPPLAKPGRLYLPDPEVVPGPVVIPGVYGWGARNRIGGVPARDPWNRIGSASAVDAAGAIGNTTATPSTGKIGSNDA